MRNSRPRILLFGSNGQVGWELQRALSPVGNVVAASREGILGPRIDLLDTAAVERLVAELNPQIIINAAAYTQVDMAEKDRDMAHRINAEVPGMLGRLAAEKKRLVIHYSTDFVFSGDSAKPYKETDSVGPLSVYGETKRAGEQALLDSGATALIFRTSWVYGIRGKNFLLTILRLCRERGELNVVDDQVGAPTWSRMLAEATSQVIARTGGSAEDYRRLAGVYHLSAAGQTSWYGFAKTIVEQSGSQCRIKPIPTSEYPLPARRPSYSVLDSSKFRDAFGLALPDWQLSLAQCLHDLCDRQ